MAFHTDIRGTTAGCVYFAKKPCGFNLFERSKIENRFNYPGSYYLGEMIRRCKSQDDERIFGSLYWNNAARKHDAALLQFEKINLLQTSLWHINRIDSSVSHLQTLGGNIFYKGKKLNISGTYYYQTGNNPLKNSSKADYSIDEKFGIGIRSDYLSGNDMNSTSSKITYFNPLYGTHDKFYGFMDYFYVQVA